MERHFLTTRWMQSLTYYRKENPGLCLGFQKAYSVVLKKLPRGAKIFFGSPTENK